ncbi:MAG: ATP-dependent DNA helicase RecG [Calditrichaeota bacterium]|nr:MAG: ATP-dependent DNA helicase RecG [Calditrichota bacterium]
MPLKTTTANTPHPLDTPVQFLKGVGEKRAEVLEAAGISTLEDLLEFRPRRYLDRSEVKQIAQLQMDEEVTVIGEVVAHQIHRGRRKRLSVAIHDGTGILEAVWFNQVEFFSRIFSQGQIVAFSGKVGRFRYWQMVHPDFDIIGEKKEQLNTGQLIPLYPSTQEFKKVGLSHYRFRQIFSRALQKYGDSIPETLPDYLLKKYRLISRAEAYRQMHFPDSLEMVHQVWRRFKYEELFYLQMVMAIRRRFHGTEARGKAVRIDDSALKELIHGFPFTLTGAQQRVLEEIKSDLESGKPMNRLLQGDVGSGKTVIALLTMMCGKFSGYQAALMAPTEILAQQHYFNIRELLGDQPVKMALLIGSLTASEKREIHRQLSTGELDLVIGTHALIQEGVEFKNLGIVVIDEQHRFGVTQRGELIEKGDIPHVLVMTATPIPRTLALTIYGDLDVSVIDELPPGRQTIKTFWRTEERLPKIYEFIREHLRNNEQVYVVYPLIEESEKMDLKAATEAFQFLQKKIFPDYNLALLHGRLKMPEKEAIMDQFKKGEVQLLVATTVIEVGVDVPQATIMMIEHAERFGLSQLHQLRGRVGRGALQSYCILVTPPEINEIARERMQVMESTCDGFVIAEEDLRLRGSGEFFGTRQHGMPDLRYANLVTDQNIISVARKDAFEMINSDPYLRKPEHRMVRTQFIKNYIEKYRLPSIA